MSCPVCTERDDLAGARYLRYGVPRDAGQHGITDHTEFAQLAWEAGITKGDNPDDWRELRRVTRGLTRPVR